MKIGLGVDTGGTCTDAVLYDMERKKIIASAKALTTKQDLSIGISAALEQLPPEQLSEAALVSLSTTLATNACVEDKGGRAKLCLLYTSLHLLDPICFPPGLRCCSLRTSAGMRRLGTAAGSGFYRLLHKLFQVSGGFLTDNLPGKAAGIPSQMCIRDRVSADHRPDSAV